MARFWKWIKSLFTKGSGASIPAHPSPSNAPEPTSQPSALSSVPPETSDRDSSPDIAPVQAAPLPPYVAPVRPQLPGAALPVATEGYGRKHSSSGATWAVDVSLPVGWRYRAIGVGVVVRVSDADADALNGTGVWVRLDSGPWAGKVIAGIHLSERFVQLGQSVYPGQVLGLTGDTGKSTGPHLHLEMSDMTDPMRKAAIGWTDSGWTWSGWD